VKSGGVVAVPCGCKYFRIHQSGDFFSQAYFDMWLQVCSGNPRVLFWAFTKSVNFWVERLGSIPRNIILTASYGGKHDGLIKEYGLKSVKVVREVSDADGLPIDSNVARARGGDFCILDTNVRGRDGCADIGGGGLIKEKVIYNPLKTVVLYF